MKKILMILLLLTSILSYGQKVDKLIHKGIDAGKAENYKKALSYLDKALKIEPDNYEALYFKGYALQNLKEFNEAINFYSLSLKQKERSDTYHRRGYCYFRILQDSLAVIDLSIAIELDPTNVDALMSRVSAYKRMEEYDLMLQDMNTYLEKHPNDFYVKANKAIVLTLLDRSDEAVIIYSELIKERPNEKKLYHGISNLYLKTEQFEKALLNVEKAIKLDPNYTKGYTLKAEILMNMKNNELACKAFNKAIELGIEESDDEYKEIKEYCNKQTKNSSN